MSKKIILPAQCTKDQTVICPGGVNQVDVCKQFEHAWQGCYTLMNLRPHLFEEKKPKTDKEIKEIWSKGISKAFKGE